MTMTSASLSPPSDASWDEETARAELYGLLSRLYYAPPDADLMAQLRVAVTEAPASGGFLEEPWRAVVAAALQNAMRLPQSAINAVLPQQGVFLGSQGVRSLFA